VVQLHVQHSTHKQ